MNRLYRRILLIALGVTCAVAAFAATGARAQDTDFERAPVLQASRILPPALVSGPNHRVQENVVNDGYLNIYTVESRFGQVRAASTAQLQQYVQELNAVARMEAVQKSDEFKRGVTEKAGDVVRGAKNLVTDPVNTVSGAASGVGALFSRAGEAIVGGGHSEAEDSRVKAAIGFSKTKRDYAYEFGVDVYSRNPILQQHLDSLAWSGYAGSMTMSALLMAVPGSAGVALSIPGTSELLNKVFRDLPPNELRKRNRAKLEAMGIASDVVDLYIANAVFTPREQTVIVEALEGMQGVTDRGAFVKFAVLTENPDLAFFRQRQAEMYASYHRKVAPLARFVPVGRTTAALSRDGTLVFNAPLDHLVWTRQNAEFARSVSAQIDGMPGVRAKHLWLAGGASPLARQNLEKLGWKVFEGAEARLAAGG
ncbi:MAG TPA: hypothetical protein VJP78_00575 [Thermoleophilia bacterium]|nr:hypothetical protein [Thermoleophilia bacterium]